MLSTPYTSGSRSVTPSPSRRRPPRPARPAVPPRRAAPLLLAVGAALAAASCAGPGVSSLYDTSPERPEFFALPWPSDARLLPGPDGRRRLDLGGFYNPGFGIGAYIDTIAADALDGFGTQSAIYFRFSGPLDPAALPASSPRSIAADASVFLVDVTPSSPTFGRRHPIRTRFSARGGTYIGPNWLALAPEVGFPLRQRTTYTAVVTDGVLAADGGPVRRAPAFDTSPTLGALAALPRAVLGVDPSHIVVATTFTTQDATSTMAALREAVHRTATPAVADLEFRRTDKKGGRWDQYVGTFQLPNFQEGDPPYTRTGGRLHVGADGHLQPVRTETVRFAVTVPRRVAMPESGWPVVLYAHGTTGDFESFIDDGSASAAAQVLDENRRVIGRMAMISIDQVLHGPRDPTGSRPTLTFFNLQNIEAARDNTRQGAADDFQLLRLVRAFNVTAAPETGLPIRFDPERIYFKGHSQGGLTGPLFLAYEPDVKAAVLSGAGANLTLSLLNKTEPVDILSVINALLNEQADPWHPLLNLLQTYFEPADPANYARLFFREPPAGLAPKSIFQSLGLVDHYTPVVTIEALALAMGVQPVTPTLAPVPSLGLEDIRWADPPLAQNVGAGRATGVLLQYLVPTGDDGAPSYDGHYVVFADPMAVRQSNTFLAMHATTGIATLVK